MLVESPPMQQYVRVADGKRRVWTFPAGTRQLLLLANMDCLSSKMWLPVQQLSGCYASMIRNLCGYRRKQSLLLTSHGVRAISRRAKHWYWQTPNLPKSPCV